MSYLLSFTSRLTFLSSPNVFSRDFIVFLHVFYEHFLLVCVYFCLSCLSHGNSCTLFLLVRARYADGSVLNVELLKGTPSGEGLVQA